MFPESWGHEKHFFKGWEEEGYDIIEISMIQQIWISIADTTILSLESDTLGVSGCV
jgi:hypothetical protein